MKASYVHIYYLFEIQRKYFRKAQKHIHENPAKMIPRKIPVGNPKIPGTWISFQIIKMFSIPKILNNPKIGIKHVNVQR